MLQKEASGNDKILANSPQEYISHVNSLDFGALDAKLKKEKEQLEQRALDMQKMEENLEAQHRFKLLEERQERERKEFFSNWFNKADKHSKELVVM